MPPECAEILIIGGGIAGLSTAFHLAQAGQQGVVLLDREDLPGFYASGHNAGIARQLTGKAEHTTLTLEGARRLHMAGLIDGSGGLLLGANPGGTDALAREAEAFGLPVQRHEGTPITGLKAAEHLLIPSDGVIDIDLMLNHCAEGARAQGASLRFGCEVRAIHSSAAGFEVETDQGTLQTRILVNAAGGWCGELGKMAGGLDIAFQPLRRHLVWSNAPYPAHQPWAWWADRPLYVRPESGGLLLCACEEQETPLPTRHTQPENDDSILEGLAASLRELAPTLADLPIARLWCGLRTFAPDRRFVIGYDPINPHLFWVAGLGGHGMTSGLAVGELAAQAILGKANTGVLDPGRLKG
ncbi:MAG: FAD-binding oxidoreductase [Holophaga sp.]|nr:FAD-binding oxidoreductase [Holophaga sp.]